MNRVFTTVWNHRLGAWVVASEHAPRHGRRGGTARRMVIGVAVAGVALLNPAWAASLPGDGQVVMGNGQIGRPGGNQLVIQQNSDKLAIHWQSFDIDAGHQVIFNQPGRDSVALNRVLGSDGSRIMGQLDANGRVFLINPNGVLFGVDAQVNVGGLVASTLDINDEDFAAGNYRFHGNGRNASVVNQGRIQATDGGAVALLGGTVSNQGVMVAHQGSVTLAAGNQVTLDFAGDGLLKVQVDEAVVDALVENHQLIKADGGQVLLTANASDALLKTVVNNTGVIEARTLGEKSGRIVLLGDFDGGSVQVAGSLDASAPGSSGNGGFIETSGAHVQIADTAKVTTQAEHGKTGLWLIDPNDFTIAASGGDISGAAVTAALQNSNFEIQTATMGSAGGNGDIHVNDALNWNSANTLTLTAERNLNLNANISAGNGGLTLNAQNAISASGAVDVGRFTLANGHWRQLGTSLPGFAAKDFRLSTGSFLRASGGTGSALNPWLLTDVYGLQGMVGFLGNSFSLANDIDASGTALWNCNAGVCNGFAPIGDYPTYSDASRYNGVFDGQSHVISDLSITAANLPRDTSTGLFGATGTNAQIRQIGLKNANVSNAPGSGYRRNTGAMVGYNLGSISQSYATGTVKAVDGYIGGLIGHNNGNVSQSYATAAIDVAGGSNSIDAGGLIGFNAGSVSLSYATGAVSASGSSPFTYVAGLIANNHGTISQSYATGAVNAFGGSNAAGGLVASNYGALSQSYATGAVNASGSNYNYVGGLTAVNFTSISQSYATGAVSASGGFSNETGGLVGLNFGTISHAYASGEVSASGNNNNFVGGLVGRNDNDSISHSYAIGDVSVSGSGTHYIGGLAGESVGGDANISRSYATGKVNESDSGTSFVGGLIGRNSASTSENYWDVGSTGEMASTGTGNNAGIRPLTAANRYQHSSYATLGSWSETASGSGIWVARNDLGNPQWIMFEGQTRPFLFSEYSRNIHNAHQLQLMAYGLTANYQVERDIDASATAGNDASGMWNSANGFVPIGDNRTNSDASHYIGIFDGQGHVIHDLSITSDATGHNSLDGLFSITGTRAELRNVGLENVIVRTAANIFGRTGGLVGYNYGSISQSYVTGTVSGSFFVGGLVGVNEGSISQSYAAGMINGQISVGGLVGYNHGSISQSYTTGAVSGTVTGSHSVGGLAGTNTGSINQSYSTGTVSGSEAAGGLAGSNDGSISQSYATGTVSGQISVGGLAGYNTSSIRQSYSTGTVSGAATDSRSVGGLAGTNTGSISQSYSTSTVSGSEAAGGLVGDNSRGSISQSYAAGTTSGSGSVGGLAGFNYGSITDSYWDIDGTGQTQAVGADNGTSNSAANGLDPAEMHQAGSFANWNLATTGGSSSVWRIYDGYTAPLLRAFLKAVTVTPSAIVGDKTYDGSIVSGSTTFTTNIADAVLEGSLSYATASNNAGTYRAADGSLRVGLYSGQQGYDISYTSDTSLTIDKAILSISGTRANGKTYDGSSVAGINAGILSGLIGNETLGVSASGTFDSRNAGSRTATAHYTLADGGNGGLASNYSLADTTGLSATIDKAILSISGTRANDKTYDGNSVAGISAGTLSGLVGSETLGVSASGAFDSRNAGSRTTTAHYTLADGGNGGLASNYSLADTTGLSATIDKAILSISGTRANSKTYDGSSVAGINLGTLSGLVGNESLGVSASGEFDSRNAGNRTATVHYTLADGGNGGLASNYSLADTTGLSATIDKAILSISGSSANGKTYDGSSVAGINLGTLSGLVGNESLGVSASGEFDSRNAGNRTATAHYTLANGGNGGLASNYSLADTTGLSATIDKAILSISGSSANGKTYDGSSVAGINLGTLSGLVGNESLGVSASGEFDSRNAGNRTATANYTLADGGNGGLASNYSLADTTGLSATIDKAILNISANDAQHTFDGAGWSGGNGVHYSGFIAGEDDSVLAGELSYGGSAQGASDVGRYTLSVSGLSADNYDLRYQDGTLDITRAPVRDPSGYGDVLAALYNPLNEPAHLQLATDGQPYQIIGNGIRLPEGL